MLTPTNPTGDTAGVAGPSDFEMLTRDEAIRRDAFLECARLIDTFDILEASGMLAKRKRDREDAALRVETARRVAKRHADLLRARATNGFCDVFADLERIDGSRLSSMLEVKEAIALQERGLVDIELVTTFDGWNTAPATAEYRLSLSDRGRKALDEHRTALSTRGE